MEVRSRTPNSFGMLRRPYGLKSFRVIAASRFSSWIVRSIKASGTWKRGLELLEPGLLALSVGSGGGLRDGGGRGEVVSKELAAQP